MQQRCLYLFFLCLWVGHTALAQTKQVVWQAYKKAKVSYAAADYEGAKEAFSKLIAIDTACMLTPYALFYYALAAYHNKESALAEETLKRLRQAFPAWEQDNEVVYWLSQLRFEAADYITALDYLAQLPAQALAKPVRQLKAFFLQRVESIAMLQTLLKQYPSDQVIAEVLFNKVVQQPIIKQDFDLLDALSHDYNLRVEAHDPLQGVYASKKNGYNVAVLLPFFADEMDYEEVHKHHFVLALYEGIKTAVEVLAKEGIRINLFAYDTKKDVSVTTNLLAQEEMKGMDLIIGPLYPATIPLVAAFANEHQISLFNPISCNAEVIGNNPFVFLLQPSLETQAKKAAEFTLQSATDITVGIFYGPSREDAIKAYTYQQHIAQHTGKAVALMLQFESETVQKFLDTFKKQGIDQAYKQVLPKLTHLYVASHDELIIANILSLVEMLGLNPCIIGDEAWLKQEAVNLDQLQSLQLRLVAPNYMNYAKESIHAFRHLFFHQMGHYPTYYAYIGYDKLLFLGHMLAAHGVLFQKHWKERYYEGAIFAGYHYGSYHDNQHVPIVKFQDGVFLICNENVVNTDNEVEAAD